MIISLKEITNTTDVVFFVIAILLLVINIVLNIRNFFVIKSSQNKVDNSNYAFNFMFSSYIPVTFLAYCVISNYMFHLIIAILCVVNIWTDLIKMIMRKPIDKFNVIMGIIASALFVFAVIFFCGYSLSLGGIYAIT